MEASTSAFSYARLRVELKNVPDLRNADPSYGDDMILVKLDAQEHRTLRQDSHAPDRCGALKAGETSRDIEIIPNYDDNDDFFVEKISLFNITISRGVYDEGASGTWRYGCGEWGGKTLFEAKAKLNESYADFMRLDANGYHGVLTCDLAAETCSISHDGGAR